MDRSCGMGITRCIGLLYFFIGAVYGQGCAAKSYGINKVVCVCNDTYCDNIQPHESLLQPGFYLQYTSTQVGQRLVPTVYAITNASANPANVWQVSPGMQYQEMLGFGGALTDSVGFNLGTLNKAAREKLLDQYFGQGIGYTFVRIPLGGSDFSPRFYTYDDGTPDETLSRFNLAPEDYKYKLPYLALIKKMSNPKIITAPWSPPTWMVESRNGSLGFTRLKPNYYQTYAQYFVNFLHAYKQNGIDIWGVSTQNEPGDGYYAYFGINSCGFSPEEERNFIMNNLGPTLRKNGFGNVSIFDCEDQRKVLPDWAETILEAEEACNYVNYTTLHWYFDDRYPASRLSELHDKYKDKGILYTEASFIPSPGKPPVLFGDWGRTETLCSDMIDVFNNWVTGWIDWNLALDTTGGPTYLKNYLDSAIIINATANEFYKQPIFYCMAHFSKFVPPGSKRIELTPVANGVESVAFLREDNIVVVIFLNRHDDDKKFDLKTGTGFYLPISVQARSLNTVLFYNN